MSAPIYGIPPKIRQEGASIVVYDNASWFTQSENERATRYVHVWFWNGANVWGTPAPPWRSTPSLVQAGEGASRIPLGPTNIGGTFRVVEYGGVESPAFGDEPAWTEWGREWSGNRDDMSRWGARSGSVTVTDWRTPAAPSASETRRQMVAAAKAWQDGQPGGQELARITMAREILETTDVEWYAIRERVRAILDEGGA